MYIFTKTLYLWTANQTGTIVSPNIAMYCVSLYKNVKELWPSKL